MMLVQCTTWIGAAPLQLDFGELRVPPPLDFHAAFVGVGRGPCRGRRRSRGLWRRVLSAAVAELAPEAREGHRSQCGLLTCMACAAVRLGPRATSPLPRHTLYHSLWTQQYATVQKQGGGPHMEVQTPASARLRCLGASQTQRPAASCLQDLRGSTAGLRVSAWQRPHGASSSRLSVQDRRPRATALK